MYLVDFHHMGLKFDKNNSQDCGTTNTKLKLRYWLDLEIRIWTLHLGCVYFKFIEIIFLFILNTHNGSILILRRNCDFDLLVILKKSHDTGFVSQSVNPTVILFVSSHVITAIKVMTRIVNDLPLAKRGLPLYILVKNQYVTTGESHIIVMHIITQYSELAHTHL